MSNRSLAGALMVVASAVCFSTKAILAKLAFRYGADATTVLALRMGVALPFVAIGLLSPRAPLEPPIARRDLLRLLALGSLGYYFASLFDFLGLTYVSAGLERLILFTYPTLVIAFNALFYREPPTARLLPSLALGYGGVALVVWNDHGTPGSNVALGSTLVFIGAIAYAFYLSGSQPLIMRYGSARVTSWVLVVSCLCAIGQFALTRGLGTLSTTPRAVLVLSAATGVFATVVPAFLLTAGMKRLGSSRASLLGMVGPVSTLVLACWFLDEPITALQLLGSALVLAGVFYAGRKPKEAVAPRAG